MKKLFIFDELELSHFIGKNVCIGRVRTRLSMEIAAYIYIWSTPSSTYPSIMTFIPVYFFKFYILMDFTVHSINRSLNASTISKFCLFYLKLYEFISSFLNSLPLLEGRIETSKDELFGFGFFPRKYHLGKLHIWISSTIIIFYLWKLVLF